MLHDDKYDMKLNLQNLDDFDQQSIRLQYFGQYFSFFFKCQSALLIIRNGHGVCQYNF